MVSDRLWIYIEREIYLPTRIHPVGHPFRFVSIHRAKTMYEKSCIHERSEISLVAKSMT